jgi:hypothetical protein
MAQAVSRWTFTAEDLVRAQVSPCENCVGEIGTGTGFSTSYTVFPCQYHSTVALLTCTLSSGRLKISPLVAAVQRHHLTAST